MSKNGILNKVHRPGKKTIIALVIVAVLAVGIFICTKYFTGGENVEFKILAEGDIPQEIVSQVIPEYRQMERALACMVGDKVYVVASRGEKPTSGYEITIDKMKLVQEDEAKKLEVCTVFKDPEPNTAMTQVLTYPIQVAETTLNNLPDKIELQVKYLD